MPVARERRWWTSQEDAILKNEVQAKLREDGTVQNWNDIASLLSGRTNKDCRKRWSKVQADIRKGAWSKEEDEKLQKAVQQLGFKWSRVATMVETRNADQCAKRWQHVLGPDFKHSPWTADEDRKLQEAMKKYGNNWKQIGVSDLPDRSTHDIRNRSLLLGRRSRNASKRNLGTTSHQHQSRSSIPEMMMEDGSLPDEHTSQREEGDGEDEEEDSGDEDGNSDCEFDDASRRDHHSTTVPEHHITQDTSADLGPQFGTQSYLPPGSLGTPKSCTSSILDLTWTNSTSEPQSYQELPTPDSDCLSWLTPYEIPTDPAGANQSSSTAWWDSKTDALDQTCFLSDAATARPDMDAMGYFDLPAGMTSETKAKGHGRVDSTNTISTSADAQGDIMAWESEQKGSVTLTLHQVDPNVAHEIMGSVLKHSAGLKIRCIVNDN